MVAHHPRRIARRNAVARSLLPRPRNEPRDRSAHPRPSPAGFGRHSGPWPTVLVVSGIGTDAEATRAVRAAAGARQRDRTLRNYASVVGAPHSVGIEAPPRSCARKKPETGDF
jgi:hypothetical protein